MSNPFEGFRKIELSAPRQLSAAPRRQVGRAGGVACWQRRCSKQLPLFALPDSRGGGCGGRSPPICKPSTTMMRTHWLLATVDFFFASCLHRAIAGWSGRSPPHLQNIDEDLSSFAAVDKLIFASRLHCETAGGWVPFAKHGRRSERTSFLQPIVFAITK